MKPIALSFQILDFQTFFSKPKNELPLVVVFCQEKIHFKTQRFSLPSRLKSTTFQTKFSLFQKPYYLSILQQFNKQ